jgi:hypothetical protein
VSDVTADWDDKTLLDMLRAGAIHVEQLSDAQHLAVFGCTYRDLAEVRKGLVATVHADLAAARRQNVHRKAA